MEQLQATFDKLLRETSTTFHRYMYDRINWDARMIGLMGPIIRASQLMRSYI